MRCKSSSMKFSIAILLINIFYFCDGEREKRKYITTESSESYVYHSFPWRREHLLRELHIFTPHCSSDRIGEKECKTQIGKQVLNCIISCEKVDANPKTECVLNDQDLITSKNYCFHDRYTTNFPTSINLTNMAMMINERDPFLFNWLDFDVIVAILNNMSYQINKTGYELPFFNVVNNLQKLNERFLWGNNYRDKILKSMNKFLIDLAMEDKPFHLNMSNIATKIIIKPSILNSNDHYNITLDGVWVKIPKDILNTSILTIFKTDYLFKNDDIKTKIVNLTIMGVHEPLKKPISIYLKVNSSKKHVCQILEDRYWRIKNVKTIILSDDLVECQTDRLKPIRLSTFEVNGNQEWCRTRYGKTVFPSKILCSNSGNVPVTEKCELNEDIIIVLAVNECSDDDLSHLTTFLYQIENQITPSNLKNLSMMINSQSSNVTALDLYLIAGILNNVSNHFTKSEYKQPFLNVVNNIFNVNQSNFESELKSTDTISKSIQKFLIDLSKENESFSVDMSNIAIKTIEPNISSFSGRYITLDGVSVNISNEILNTLTLTEFKTNHLFPKNKIVSNIVNITTIREIEMLQLNNSISIYFHTNSSVQVVCSSSYWWDPYFHYNMFSSRNMKTIRLSDDLIECQTSNYLGTFALLEAQFCLEEDTDDKIPHTWCKIQAGRIVLPCKNPCVNSMGVPATRKCEQDNYKASWSKVEHSCSLNNLSYFTKFYNEIQFHKITPTNLTDVAKIINNNSSLTVVDIHSIAGILNYTSYQDRKTEFAQPFFDTLNNLLNVNKSLFKDAHEFGSTNNVLQAVDKFLNDLSKENTSLIVDKSNVIVQIIEPNIWNNITSQKVSINIPNILKTSILTIFKTNHLFPQGNVESKIIDLKIIDVKGILNNPISIYFEVDPLIEVECSLWKILDEDIGYWSNRGVKTIRLNNNVVECQANHLGALALLKVSDEFCPEENTYGKVKQTRCKTPVGRIAIPCKNPCLNDNNHPVHRKCEKDDGVSKWLKIEGECSNGNLSNFTMLLNQIEIHNIIPTNLTDVANALDGVWVKIPKDILNTSILTTFKTDYLFKNDDIKTKIVNLTIMGVHEPLKKPISIYLKVNSSKKHVCQILEDRYWRIKNVKTIILSDDLVECQTDRLKPIRLSTFEVNGNQEWCRTRYGKTVFPSKILCSNSGNVPVTEKCELNEDIIIVLAINECSDDDISHLTTFLYQIENQITPSNLKNLSMMINSQSSNVTALDLYLIAGILNNVSNHFTKSEYKQPFLNVVNNIFNVNQSNFESELKSTDTISKSIQKFLIDLSKENESFSVDMSNIAIKTIEPNTSSFSGRYNITLDGVSVKISNEILNRLTLTVFKTNHLFPKNKIVSNIVNITTIREIEMLQLNNSISIYFHTNSSVQVVCSSSYWWDPYFHYNMFSSRNMKTIRLSDDLIECQTSNYLGTFALLEAQFCLEEDTDDKIPYTWCKIQAGRIVLPCKNPCVNSMGVPATRKCEQDNYKASWSKVEHSCSLNNLSYFTKFYNEIQFHKITPTNLTDVAKIINNNSSLTVVDIHSIAGILNYTSYQDRKTEFAQPFFDTLNNLLNVNKSLFKDAHEFGSTNNVLQAVDKFLNDLSKENTSLIVDKSNVIVQIIEPNIWNNITSQKVSINIPNILKTSILTIFKTNHLFPQGNVESKIIDLKIMDVKGILNNPISIYLEVDPLIEVECSLWKILHEDIGYWSNRGVKTIRLNNNVVECQANHLGAFALVKVSDEFCPEENTYGKVNQTRCKTPVGRIAIPCKNPCLNDNNHPVHRNCEKDDGVSKWLKIEGECSNGNLSNFTMLLNQIEIHNIIPTNLTDVANALDGVWVKIPKDILNTSILTTFKTDYLFKNDDIKTKIVNLTIMGVHEPLKKPISIYLKVNSSKKHVCQILEDRYWRIKNVKTIILSDDLVECQTDRLKPIRLSTFEVNGNQEWCRTRYGKTVFPSKILCSNSGNVPVTEKCELNEDIIIVLAVNECSDDDLSHLTTFLYQIENQITPSNLKNLSMMINSQSSNVTALDLYLIAGILNNVSNHFTKSEYKQPFLNVVNNIFNVNQSNFESELKSTDTISKSIQKFLIGLSKENESFSVDMSNIAIKTIEPNTSSFSGRYNITLDRVSVKISNEILNTLTLTEFKTNHLFPKNKIVSNIVNITTIREIEMLQLNNSISIYFHTNSSVQVVCSSSHWWDPYFHCNMFSSRNMKTIRLSDDLIECQTSNYLGTFALLEAQFCLEEDTDDKIPHTWCKIQAGRIVLPCKNPCVNSMGVPATRKCEQDNYKASWSKVEHSCSLNNLSYFTKFYNEIQFHKITPTNLTDVAKIINNNSSLTVVDIHSIAGILNYTSYQDRKTEFAQPFFDTLNNLLNVNKSLFKDAHEFGSTNNVLQAVDKFLNDLSKENTSLIVDKSNVIVQIIEPNIWNNITSQKVSINIPNILKTSILTIFKTNHLFPQGNVESKIIDLKIMDVKGILNNPISIYLEVDPLIEVECSLWKILDEDIGYWSNRGVKTIRLNNNVVECQANHLGAFALLKVSDEFCPEENTYGKVNQTWCKTPVGRIAIPCKNPCLNDNNHPVYRKCEKNDGVSKWLKIEGECSNGNLSNFTMFRNQIEIHNIIPTNLTDVANAINNDISSLTVVDVDQIAEILNYISNQDKKIEFAEPFFDIVNNLLKVHQSVFKAAKEFGSTDKTLKLIDKFTTDLSKENESLSINKPNVAIKIIKPNSNSNDSYNIKLPKLSINIPNDILNTTTLTTFKNNNLFPEGNVNTEVIDLKIAGVEGNLTNPISIYLEVDSCENFECFFWDFNDTKIGNWSTKGVKTIRINDTHVECQAYHLTPFVFLGISDRVNLSTMDQKKLDIITNISCTLSLIGIIVVFITCIVLEKWHVKRIYTIKLSSVITLEIFMLFLKDFFIDGSKCLYFGILMHYLVLVKFMIMLIIAKMQYENYVSVLKSRYRSKQSYSIMFVTFSFPILIVGTSAGMYSKHYSNNVQFCYPKAEAFKYFLIIPIGLILLANTIVFSLVIFKISKSMSRNTKQKILQAKLAVMLFFFLGLTWIFSVFSLIICTPWIRLIFIYVFSILSSLQGFVIFIFTIVFDVNAKNFWLNFCNRFIYSPLNRQINSSTTFTLISEVTSDDLQNETSQNQILQTFNSNNEHNRREDNEGRIRRYLRRFGWKYF